MGSKKNTEKDKNKDIVAISADNIEVTLLTPETEEGLDVKTLLQKQKLTEQVLAKMIERFSEDKKAEKKSRK